MRLIAGGLIAGALGLVLCAIGLLVAPAQAFFSWLMAWAYATSIALGALILVMIENAAGSRWFLVFRRLGEAIAAALVPLALLFVPLLFGLARLYPWAAGVLPEDEHARHVFEHKRAYLNPGFFAARSAVYLVLFAVTAILLGRWSLRQDHDADPALSRRQRAFSSALLPPIAIALTFGAIDWLMSLSPAWYSTVYGIYWWAGGFVASIALVIIAARGAAAVEHRPPHFYAMGRMLLAFVIFWTYIAYAQGFIIWIGNKPEDVTWYVRRTQGGWGGVAVALFVLHFAVPFAVLLLRAVKYRPRALAAIAGLVLAAHFIDIYWVVMPALHASPAPHWLDLAALAAIVGPCAAFAGVWLRGHALVPLAAPELPLGLAYDAGMTAGGDA